MNVTYHASLHQVKEHTSDKITTATTTASSISGLSAYESLELLGEGAYGLVYGAIRVATTSSNTASYNNTIPPGTRVAIKQFKGT
jgi:serine/threonine protein kinase